MITGLPAWINRLSLDVAAGTALLSASVAREAGQEPDPLSYFLLGLFVWIIYTFDHLYGSQGPFTRHRLHQTYAIPIRAIFFLAIPTCFILAVKHLSFYEWLSAGITLFILCNYYLIYFFSSQFRMKYMSREIVIAMGFTGGVLTLPLGQESIPLHSQILPMGIIVFCFAIINLLLLSAYEQRKPVVIGEGVAGGWLSGNNTGTIFIIFFSIALLLTIAGVLLKWFSLAFFISCMLYLAGSTLLFIKPSWFRKMEIYRQWIDAFLLFFLIPLCT